MLQEIIVPDNYTYDSLKVLKWLVGEGETFSAGQEICELITDKAVFPLEAEKPGKLLKQNALAEDNVKPGQVLGRMEYGD